MCRGQSLHGLLLPIRKAFVQYANIRPHRLLPGVLFLFLTGAWLRRCTAANASTTSGKSATMVNHQAWVGDDAAHQAIGNSQHTFTANTASVTLRWLPQRRDSHW